MSAPTLSLFAESVSAYAALQPAQSRPWWLALRTMSSAADRGLVNRWSDRLPVTGSVQRLRDMNY